MGAISFVMTALHTYICTFRSCSSQSSTFIKTSGKSSFSKSNPHNPIRLQLTTNAHLSKAPTRSSQHCIVSSGHWHDEADKSDLQRSLTWQFGISKIKCDAMCFDPEHVLAPRLHSCFVKLGGLQLELNLVSILLPMDDLYMTYS